MGGSADESDRRFAVWAHASALVGLVLPFGQLLGPYVTSLLLPAHASRARRAAAESLNFQLQMVALVLALVVLLLAGRAGWGWFVLFVPNLYAFGMALRAATLESRGQAYRYPFVLHLLPSLRPEAAPPHTGR